MPLDEFLAKNPRLTYAVSDSSCVSGISVTLRGAWEACRLRQLAGHREAHVINLDRVDEGDPDGLDDEEREQLSAWDDEP